MLFLKQNNMSKTLKRKRSTLSESDVTTTYTYNEKWCLRGQRVGRSYSCPNTKEEFYSKTGQILLKEADYVVETEEGSHIAELANSGNRHRKDMKTRSRREKIFKIHNIRTILTIIYGVFKSLGTFPGKSIIKQSNFTKAKNLKNNIATKYNKDIDGSLDFLFQIQRHARQDLTTFPVSLNTYFDSLASGHSMSQDESMSNELLRIASYRNFPRHVNIFTSLLSKAGFYYTGHTDEVRCYACGFTHKEWKSGDNPLNFHRRMSPSCSHVMSLDSETGSITRNDNNIQNNLSQNSHPSGNSTSPTISSTFIRPTHEENTNSYSNGTSEYLHQHQESLHNGVNTSYQTGATGHEGNPDKNEDVQSSLGIEVDKPRYPNYAPLPVRISSFQGWPSYLDQTAHEMATAGFLYAGYQDYTRCFFCGGGLRNWEAGDDPWIEHARWFPKCTFLKQNKGDRFIRAVQEKQAKLDKEKNPSAQSTALSQNANPSNTDEPIKLLDSIAAKSVMEMGYTREDVFKAIQKILPKFSDVREISATSIMNILLNDDDVESNRKTDGASALSTPNTEIPPVPNSPTHESNGGALDGLNSNMEDVENLVEENRQLKDLRLCKVCLDLDASIAFLPCGHIVCCPDCAPAMRKCPMCRAFVKGTVKTFLV